MPSQTPRAIRANRLSDRRSEIARDRKNDMRIDLEETIAKDDANTFMRRSQRLILASGNWRAFGVDFLECVIVNDAVNCLKAILDCDGVDANELRMTNATPYSPYLASPLMLASRLGSLECARVLAQRASSHIWARNAKRATAMDLAALSGGVARCVEIAGILATASDSRLTPDDNERERAQAFSKALREGNWPIADAVGNHLRPATIRETLDAEAHEKHKRGFFAKFRTAGRDSRLDHLPKTHARLRAVEEAKALAQVVSEASQPPLAVIPGAPPNDPIPNCAAIRRATRL